MFRKSKKKKPLLVLIAVISFDRFLALPQLRDYTIGPGDVEFVSYQQAPLVLESLKASVSDTRPAAFVLGSSRSNGFGAASAAYQTYNFSAAMACPSHYAYWLERASSVRRPDLVLLETDPLQLSAAVIENSLAYGYDTAFVFSHLSHHKDPWPGTPAFTLREAAGFFRKRMLYVDRFPGAPVNLWRNLRARLAGDDAASRNRLAREMLESYARMNRGIIPSEQFRMTATDQDLRHDAQRFEKYMRSFSLSSTQTGFMLAVLRKCEREKIPVILYRAMAAAPYREAQSKHGLDAPITQLKKIVAGMTQVRFVDPAESSEVKCRRYIDALHLQGDCIREQDAFLFAQAGK